MTSWTMFDVAAELERVAAHAQLENTSDPWMRCSSGSAIRGSALGMPKVTAPIADAGTGVVGAGRLQVAAPLAMNLVHHAAVEGGGQAADQEALVIVRWAVGRMASRWRLSAWRCIRWSSSKSAKLKSTKASFLSLMW